MKSGDDLLPETIEMLSCIKDWELGKKRLQHAIDNQELEDSFENLYLNEDAFGAASAGTFGVSIFASAYVASAGT